MRLLGALFLPAALAFAITYSVTSAVDVPETKPEPATSVVWGGRVFETRADFVRWLRTRGVNYPVWARRHPAILGRQTPAARPEPGRTSDSAKGALLGVAAVVLVVLLFCLRAQLVPVSTTGRRFLVRAGRAARSSPDVVVRATRATPASRWYLTGLILTAAMCVLVAARN